MREAIRASIDIGIWTMVIFHIVYRDRTVNAHIILVFVIKIITKVTCFVIFCHFIFGYKPDHYEILTKPSFSLFIPILIVNI